MFYLVTVPVTKHHKLWILWEQNSFLNAGRRGNPRVSVQQFQCWESTFPGSFSADFCWIFRLLEGVSELPQKAYEALIPLISGKALLPVPSAWGIGFQHLYLGASTDTQKIRVWVSKNQSSVKRVMSASSWAIIKIIYNF